MSQRCRVRYPVQPHTFVSSSADSRRAAVSYWQKYVHKVLVNPLGGLSLPRKSVVRLTDRPDMTLDVYHGRKTTIHQPINEKCIFFCQHHVKNILDKQTVEVGWGGRAGEATLFCSSTARKIMYHDLYYIQSCR